MLVDQINLIKGELEGAIKAGELTIDSYFIRLGQPRSTRHLKELEQNTLNSIKKAGRKLIKLIKKYGYTKKLTMKEIKEICYKSWYEGAVDLFKKRFKKWRGYSEEEFNSELSKILNEFSIELTETFSSIPFVNKIKKLFARILHSSILSLIGKFLQ